MEEKWGKYILRRRIAVGGMAEVFEADMTGPSGFLKTVCLKRIKPDFSSDETFKHMFEGEARLAAGLDHPNIIQVFDFAAHEDQFYLAMELIDGLDLKQIIEEVNKSGLKLPLGFSVYVMAELLGALSYAHARVVEGKLMPVVHRDVSPHNILVSTKGVVKLADFGIAKASGATDPTNTGVIKGKFAYISPEQARGQTVGPPSDLFSAGLVLFEMITGRRFFKAESEAATITKVINVSMTPIPEVSERLNGFLARLLRQDPAQRFPSADAAMEALKDLGIGAFEKAEVGALVTQIRKERAFRRRLLEEERNEKERLEEQVGEVDEKIGATAAPAARMGTDRVVSSPEASSEPAAREGDDDVVSDWAKSGSGMHKPNIEERGRKAFLWLIPMALVIVAVAVWIFSGQQRSDDPEAPFDFSAAPASSGARAGEDQASAERAAEPIPPVVALNEPAQGAAAASDAGALQEEPSVETKLPAARTKIEARTGTLEVNVRPWAQVFVDGVEKGTTPLRNVVLQPGAHQVLLVNEELGYKKEMSIRVRPSKTVTINKNIAGHTSDNGAE